MHKPESGVAAWSIVLTFGLIHLSAQNAAPSALSRLFESYQAGAYDDVRAGLESTLTSKAAAQALTKDVSESLPKWPVRPGAAFALEIAAAVENLDADQAYSIIDAAARRLRAVSPSPWEQEWQDAAVALLEGPISSRSARVIAPPADPSRSLALGIDPDLPTVRVGLGEVAAEAARRFPNDQSVQFALGLAREQRIYAWARTIGAELGGGVPANPVSQGHGYEIRVLPPNRSEAESAFRRAADGPDPELRAAARLHLGSVEMFDGNTASALDEWRESALESKRPNTRYLSLLFLARAQWTRGQPAEALRSLTRALGIVPNAQSAIVMAAALGYLTGQPDAAAQTVDQLLASPETAADPFWSYFRGEFDQFEPRLAGVRAGSRVQ